MKETDQKTEQTERKAELIVRRNAGISLAELLAEDASRRSALLTDYDPIAGIGCCGPRLLFRCPDGAERLLPEAMVSELNTATKPIVATEWEQLRLRHDFEYWAATCASIKNKTTGAVERFRLNRPQRRVLGVLEGMRCAGKPIRIIMLKARQWGGSTLVQLYMAWIQLCLKTNWNSLICAHVKDTASTIRGMYSRLIDCYPEELRQLPGGGKLDFRPFEGSRNVRLMEGRGCTITLGSSENQDAVRGADYSMAHLSEVAFWRDSREASPEEFVRAIYGAVNAMPLSLIVLESTANGVGNFFHNEWLRAQEGRSDKVAVFVPWYEIEIYSLPDASTLDTIAAMDDYEWKLWSVHGCSLSQIAWFQAKRREYPSLASMLAEYPTTDVEAFTLTARNVFSAAQCELLRTDCREPLRLAEPDVAMTSFVDDPRGRLSIWLEPATCEDDSRYVAAVDVGGRSDAADWSVITVIDTIGVTRKGIPEVAAMWRGHTDHDRLASTACAIARYYASALLVFESNTFETESDADDPAAYILERVAREYPNLYYRAGEGCGRNRIGFHTNRSTKSTIINHLIALVRDHAYVEHSHLAVNELVNYETTPSGGYSARRGTHDDILMSRAIALYIASTLSTALPSATPWDRYSGRYRR